MMKAKVRFVESNRRLESKKTRTATIEIDEKDFRTNNVKNMEQAFMYQIKGKVFRDSVVVVKTIKVGRVEFVL